MCSYAFSLFFFNDTATTEIYTLSLHDALPISRSLELLAALMALAAGWRNDVRAAALLALAGASNDPDVRSADRKSTRLNSSHLVISYAVFCLKKKKRKAGGGEK